MRTLLPIGAVLLLILAFLFSPISSPTDADAPSATESAKPVNAVLGNESFYQIHGTTLGPDAPERQRLQTHLAYVEAHLRARPRPSLTPTQRARRHALLDSLRAYRRAGRFPRNTEVPGRSPVFIDGQGRLCAVGHLIAVSAGRDLAERIDAQYHLADVRDMDLPAIDRWAEAHGFTRRELAMIQPWYGGVVQPGPRPEDDDPTALEVTALSASVGSSLLNGVLLERGTPSTVGGAVGVGAGTTSLIVGLRDDAGYPTASTLTGATSIVLGGWALTAALWGEEASPSSSATQSSSQWAVGPTTLTTVDGETYPGVRTHIRF
jgi:hypothetical protein